MFLRSFSLKIGLYKNDHGALWGQPIGKQSPQYKIACSNISNAGNFA